MQLTAVAFSSAGDVLDGPVQWETSDSAVAAIRQNGWLLAKGPGTVTVTATSGRASDEVTVAIPARWASIYAGEGHTCALTTGGSAYCWGRNQLGQLGIGSTDSVSVPRRVQTALQFAVLSAAGPGTCGVSTSGDAFCWGSSAGYAQVTPTPKPVAVGRRFRSIDAGGTYGQACGVEVAGSAYCFGFWTSQGWPELAVAGPFRAFVAAQPMGLTTNGAVLSWSQRSTYGPSPMRGAPSAALGLTAGRSFACVRDAAGRAFCTTTISHSVGGSRGFDDFAPVTGGAPFVDISAGSTQACGITSEGRAYCWPMVEEPGLISEVRIGQTLAVGGDLRFSQLSAGHDHTCGVTTVGEAYCWGANRWGQLGSGVFGGEQLDPVLVKQP
jgi:hypothetical protein